MNVTFVLTHLSHDSPGSFFRPYEIAKALTNFVNDVKILTPFREDVENYTDVSMVELPNISSNFQITNFAYQSMRKILSSRLSRVTPYDKYLTSSSDKLAQSIEKSLKDTPDILQGELETASIATIKVGKKLGIPSVVDIHNIWPEVLAAEGYIKPESETFKNLMKMEQFIVENADGTIVVNDFMKDYLVTNFNADANKIAVIPPGGEPLVYNADVDTQQVPKEKKIIYAGLVNPYEHVDLFVKSIPYVYSKHANSKFIISDKGSDLKNIKNLCKGLPTQPKFYWYKSREKARNLLKECYVGILPSGNNVVRKLGTPLKLLEYMSFGIPIVANDIGSWSSMILDENIGILTGDDPKEFADGICELIEDEKLHNQIRKKMIKLMEKKFNWKTNIEQILIPFYQKIIS